MEFGEKDQRRIKRRRDMKFWYEVNFKYLGKVIIIIIINILKFVGKALNGERGLVLFNCEKLM